MNLKKIAAFSIGPIGGAVVGLISLPIVTWFFSQEDVGRMAMLQVALSFTILLFSLGLDQAYVREFHEVNDKPALLKRAIMPGLILLLITLAVLLTFGGKLSNWLFGVPSWQLSMLVSLALIASYISRFLSLVLRMNERGLAFSMSQLLPKVFLLIIICFYIVLDTEKDLVNLLIANSAAIGLVCLIYGWNTRAEWLVSIRSKIDLHELRRMIRFGFPLILGGLSFWGLTAIDKVFLRALATYEELAVYSVAVSFAAVATILQSVFSTIWAPTVYKWASKGEGLEKVYKVNRYILLLVIVGFCLAGLFSWVVTVFLPPAYADVQWILVSCLGYPLLYTLSESTVVGIGISRRTSFAMLAALIAFTVNIVANWALIPIYGAAGAAVSTCLSFWIFFILRTEFSMYLWKPIPRLNLYSYSIALVTGACFCTLFGERYYLMTYIYWVFILIASIFSFKAEIVGGVNLLREDRGVL